MKFKLVLMLLTSICIFSLVAAGAATSAMLPFSLTESRPYVIKSAKMMPDEKKDDVR